MSEEQTLYDTTEAGTIAGLARDATALEPHVEIIRDGAGNEIERHVYGRGSDGELQLVETIEAAKLQRDHADRNPDRLAGSVQLHTPDALLAYAQRHVHETCSTLWGDVGNARLTAILNDHGPRGEFAPDWGDHRAVLDLTPSIEWGAWTSRNEKGLSQEELAEFLEEHLVDVVDPDGSTLLEVTRTFQATTGATFRRAQSMHSGQVQLTWQEEGTAKAGSSGQLEVPREFTLALRPFLGTEPVQVKGMFRYRVSNGQLVLGFRLLNLDEVRRDAVEQILGEVADELSLTALQGRAPDARR